ncbi:extracellular solute-binding protein [Bradyrhizobium elkanii]|uniref:Multiple sugar transport system substrate-binding protein n=1 Tax=Bradyrhizobium elkanii TaxID=29448 RepID=A0A8I1YHX0_BRAEL|nr:extracellular solute-binding protein [Bradyrhizobium elkanii]MBP1299817.1 multiple sugar transport system substrate-binding protein [Bradyrhizobium elkanii]
MTVSSDMARPDASALGFPEIPLVGRSRPRAAEAAADIDVKVTRAAIRSALINRPSRTNHMMITRRKLLAGAVSSALVVTPAILRAAQRTTVTISHGNPTYQTLLSDLATQFENDNPTTAIKFVANGDNWDPLLNNTIRDSLVNSLPDGSWQALTYAGILANRKIAQPLDQFFGNDTKNLETLGLSQTIVEAATVAGSAYCLPYGTTVPVIYCNMDLLRNAGWPKARPPSTWDEIHEIGAKVLAKGGEVNGGYLEYSGANAWMFQNLLTSYGGRMMNDTGTKVTFGGSEGLQALQTLARFGEITKTDMTKEQARQAFKAGATAMHFQSASGTTSTAKAAAGRFELAVGPFPISSANGRLAGAGHGMFMFTKDPAKQKVVWEFMKFVTTQKGQLSLARNTGYMPINLLVLRDPAFIDAYFKINPHHRSIVERLEITGDQFSFSSDNTVKIMDMMSDVSHDVVTHRVKPAAGLDRMVTETRKWLG